MSNFFFIANDANGRQGLAGIPAADVLDMFDEEGVMHDESYSNLAFRYANMAMMGRVLAAPERVEMDMVQCVVSHGKVKEVTPFHQYVTLTPCVAMSLNGGADLEEYPDMMQLRTPDARHEHLGTLDLCGY